LHSNSSGNKALKGFSKQTLNQGKVTFSKISIQEVSSHSKNGWIYVVVAACPENLEHSENLEQFADSISIEPLIIEEVVIKAKSHKNE
jgi:hypothetical protein